MTRNKSPNVYKSCPKMVLLEKWMILTPLQKLHKNCCQRLYKVAQSPINRPIWSHWMPHSFTSKNQLGSFATREGDHFALRQIFCRNCFLVKDFFANNSLFVFHLSVHLFVHLSRGILSVCYVSLPRFLSNCANLQPIFASIYWRATYASFVFCMFVSVSR